MAKLVGNVDHSDIILEANDGLKIPAHLCVLQTRAPGFYRCYVKPSLPQTDEPAALPLPMNIKIPDVDGNSLRFFLRCIYTEEDVPENPGAVGDLNGYQMDRNDDDGEPKDSTGRLQQSVDSQVSVHTYVLDNGNPMTSSELSDSIHTVPEDHPNSSSALSDVSESDAGTRTGDELMMTSFAELASVNGTTTDGVDGSISDKTATSLNDVSIMNDNNDGSQHVPLDATYVTGDFSSGSQTYRRPSRDDMMTAKFIRVDDTMSTSVDSMQPPVPPPADKKIFPMFIELANERERDLDWKDGSMAPSPVSGPRVSFGSGRKRWSVTSLRSIDSADLASPISLHENLTDRFDGPINFGEGHQGACSKLGQDLLNMFLEGENADLTVITSGQELKAHRCVLSTVCPYFNAMFTGDWLENQKGVVELKEFSESVVKFTLCFIYGGVVDLPDNVSVWELLSLADMLQLDDLKNIAYLHIRGKICHFFHKPCAGCVTNVLECLPLLNSYGLKDILSKCCQWQAKYFSRIWKTKVFNQLNDSALNLCYRAVLESMNTQNVMEILLGCEKLQMTLPKNKTGEAAAGLVACLFDNCLEFLASNFDDVLGSAGFLSLGKGFALNLSLFEDLLPGIVHSLTPETGCKVLVKLYDLLTMISSQIQNGEEEWNEKFVMLLKRLYELCDTHLIHYASAVITCDTWSLLTLEMQQRIKETGIFVEIQKPRAPPPKLSSLNRTYKRSASSGDRGVRDRVPHHQRRLIKPPSKENINKDLHLSNGSLHRLDVGGDGHIPLEQHGPLKEEEEEQKPENDKPIIVTKEQTMPKEQQIPEPDTKPPKSTKGSHSTKTNETAGSNTNLTKLTPKIAVPVQKPSEGRLKPPQVLQSKNMKRSHEMDNISEVVVNNMHRSPDIENLNIMNGDKKSDTAGNHLTKPDNNKITKAAPPAEPVITAPVIKSAPVTAITPTDIIANGHAKILSANVGLSVESADAVAAVKTDVPAVKGDDNEVKTGGPKLNTDKTDNNAMTIDVVAYVENGVLKIVESDTNPDSSKKDSSVKAVNEAPKVETIAKTAKPEAKQEQLSKTIKEQQSKPEIQPNTSKSPSKVSSTSSSSSQQKRAVKQEQSTKVQPLIRKDSYTKEPASRSAVDSAKPTAAVTGVPQTTTTTVTSSVKHSTTGHSKTKPSATSKPQLQTGVSSRSGNNEKKAQS